MPFHLNLFTPETWDAFRRHGAQISGFRDRYDRLARERIKVGDVLLCYLVGLSRWCGALEVTSKAFRDDAPIFGDPDPYVVRFRVRPIVALDPEMSPPIFEDAIWNRLSETKGIEKGARGWATRFRGSLRRIADPDSALPLDVLRKQAEVRTPYPLTERDRRQLARKRTVTTLTGEVEVEVPDAQEDPEAAPVTPSQSATPVAFTEGEARESIQVQAKLARIGAQMGFRIWVPASDRARVLELIPADLRAAFLAALPVNYDDNTLDTIRQIDVLWHKGRSMARAFEVGPAAHAHAGVPKRGVRRAPALRSAPRHHCLSVQAGHLFCWKCGAETRIITGVEVDVGPTEFRFSVPDLDDYPDLFEVVRRQLAGNMGIGIAKRRFSQTVGRAYLSNGCVHCDALVGRHYEHDAWDDQEEVRLFSLRVDERWREAIRGSDGYEEGWGVYSLDRNF